MWSICNNRTESETESSTACDYIQQQNESETEWQHSSKRVKWVRKIREEWDGGGVGILINGVAIKPVTANNKENYYWHIYIVLFAYFHLLLSVYLALILLLLLKISLSRFTTENKKVTKTKIKQFQNSKSWKPSQNITKTDRSHITDRRI